MLKVGKNGTIDRILEALGFARIQQFHPSAFKVGSGNFPKVT